MQTFSYFYNLRNMYISICGIYIYMWYMCISTRMYLCSAYMYMYFPLLGHTQVLYCLRVGAQLSPVVGGFGTLRHACLGINRVIRVFLNHLKIIIYFW